jgi:membrane-associated phospholipid phosphatase
MTTGENRALTSPFRVERRVGTSTVVATVTGAAVIVVLASAVAWDGDVPNWEQDVLKSINGWPDWLKPIMWFIQQPGVLLAPLIAGAIIFWFTRERLHLFAFVAILPLKLGFEKLVVKGLVERERPFTSIGSEINVRGPAFDGLSFPSGHSTTAFAMCLLIVAFIPNRWRFLPMVWAVGIAVARLYYGEHNVLDVVAGAALGTAFAVCLRFAFVNRFAEAKIS